MQTLAIDIETYSGTDLRKSGVYKYVEDPDFEILLFGFAFETDGYCVLDLVNKTAWHLMDDGLMHDLGRDYFLSTLLWVTDLLTDKKICKTAFNAAFERACIAKYFNIVLPPEQWECTMVKCAMVGLPMSLDAAAKALHLPVEKQAEGKALIRFFCLPCKPTKANGMRTRNLPSDAPDKWLRFIEYCGTDVTVEVAIREKLAFFVIPKMEKDLWALDQKINDTGVLIDREFINAAIAVDTEYKAQLTAEAVALTGLSNPNSVKQLVEWLDSEMEGTDVTKLRKEDIPVLLESAKSDEVIRMLSLRSEMAKTSVKKYASMLAYLCEDSRVRGLLQYYGAGRTGRWAGRGIQVQNLTKHLFDMLETLEAARYLVGTRNLPALEMIFGKVSDVLSQLIRTSFVAPEGSRFIVGDFAAIEARVIAWLAGEKWRLDVFNTHGKIYEASAAQMFKVPIETISKGGRNYSMRAKGKVAELALGYQGGPNALVNMGALNMGIPEEELPKLVKMWRNENKMIVAFWKACEDAAIQAIKGNPVQIQHGIKFYCENNILFIQLPSGRCLTYYNPSLKRELVVFFEFKADKGPFKAGQKAVMPVAKANSFLKVGEVTSEPFEKLSAQYEGMNQTTKKWETQDTYGGKIVENIVQAVARDCLAVSLLRLDAAGYKLVMHVHDENVTEMQEGVGSCEEMDKIMSKPIAWAPGLPLTAESYETKYYRK